jgi:hypothetical protein
MHALVGFDFQRDKIAARATDDDPAACYFHACTVEKGKGSSQRGDSGTMPPRFEAIA